MSRNASYIKNVVGTNIKRYRDSKGFTQEQLSEMIGINTSGLSDIERGKTYPKPENLDKIAKALGIPFELLFVNTIIDPATVKEDFLHRIELIQQDPEKFTVLYNYLKTLI